MSSMRAELFKLVILSKCLSPFCLQLYYFFVCLLILPQILDTTPVKKFFVCPQGVFFKGFFFFTPESAQTMAQ
uniref:Uncharacterized protein n=1 Tax=Lutzomyia longipalpis TaxID=7200 RepID=A0A7G3B7W0_LUTLO